MTRILCLVTLIAMLLLPLLGCGSISPSYETEEDDMAQRYNYNRVYGSFRGVDFTSDERDVAEYRFSDLVNMWRDYESANGSCIETFPGFRFFADCYGNIYGMFYFKDKSDEDYVIVHAGDGLFYFKSEDVFSYENSDIRQNIIVEPGRRLLNFQKSFGFQFQNNLYVFDGNSIWRVDGSYPGSFSASIVATNMPSVPSQYQVSPYLPLTHINGEIYEQRNMISKRVKEEYVLPDTQDALDALYKVTVSETDYYRFPFHNETVAETSPYSGLSLSVTGTSNIFTIYAVDGKPSGIQCTTTDTQQFLLGQTITLAYNASESEFRNSENFVSFKEANPDYNGTALEAILGCTVAETFDGRVFLTGNPALPNTVFYCQRNLTGYADPTYWGFYNYWNDGVGGFPNVALLASGNMLMVFKGDTVQDGSVYYRTPADNTDEATKDILPRIYTGIRGVSGVGCVGAACNFYDDPVFLSRRGLDAIGKEQVNLERTVQHRSSNVDRKLCEEDLANSKLVEWKQYLLVLCPSGHVYMADSRAMFQHSTGSVQYEWFYLEGIGHQEKSKLYRYDDDNTPCSNPVIFEGNYPYDQVTGKLLHWEGENKPDGDFHGIECVAVVGEDLYFSVGSIMYCFNTDLRGKEVYRCEITENDPGPEYLKYAYVTPGTDLIPDTDDVITYTVYNVGSYKYTHANEYPTPPTVIPRWFYTYDGIAIKSGAITGKDDAGIPMYAKNTLFRTVLLNLKAMPGSKFHVLLEKDETGWEEIAVIDNSISDFCDVEFDAFIFNGERITNAVMKRRELRWYHKRYQFYSDEYARPFGIHDLSYACEIAGKVTNK